MRKKLLAMSLAALMMCGVIATTGQTALAEEPTCVPYVEDTGGGIPLEPFYYLGQAQKK